MSCRGVNLRSRERSRGPAIINNDNSLICHFGIKKTCKFLAQKYY